MAKTMHKGFNEFLKRLTPTATETEAAKNHRASIKACLEENWDMTSFFRTGSFGSGTSIRGHSDVDYFAVIPTNKLDKNSARSLSQIRKTLDTRFPNTGVRVSTPAIVVPFGKDGSETTEIVPADYVRSNDFRIYDIPNYEDEWSRSSPSAHQEWINGVNESLGGTVKPLIRFVKAWKYYREVPLDSFYLEMRVAKYASTEKSIQYSYDVRAVLQCLTDVDLSSIRDPKGVSGNIQPCRTQAQKDDALSKLSTALTRANKAMKAEKDEKFADAFYWWNLVYNGHFPSYS